MKSCTLPAIAFALVSCGWGTLTFAATFYVSTTGNNANSGLATGSAWRNVQYAADHVQAGDSVNVLGGVYHETVNVTRSGSAASGSITFQNYSGQTPILDGTGLAIPNGQFGMFHVSGQS